MSTEDQFISYTPDEQKTLTALETNSRILKNTLLFLQEGNFPGKNARAIVECELFHSQIYNQTQYQMQLIQEVAKKRTSEAAKSSPAPAPVASEPKVSKTKKKVLAN
jgi:hypothetical protein